ncbi:MAG: rhomboid family intramembrane serine protease [Polyangiaceae bacterium]
MENRRKPVEAWPGHVTAGVCALAICVTLLSWTGKDVSPLYLTEDAFFRQPWRILTSALVHANIRGGGMGSLSFTHLVFNCLMLFQYGRALEQRIGPSLTGLFYVLAAIAAGTAQYALGNGGIGLSGVGFAVFGYLWVASKRDRAYEDAIDYRGIVGFVFWFFFCVVATKFEVMRIANVAHFVGGVFGATVGFLATSRTNATRTAWGIASAALAGGSVLLAAKFPHALNLSSLLGI